MTGRLEVYKCEICGNIIEVIHASGGTLVCCNKSMTLLKENSTDASQEKHVPVIQKTADGVKVTVGSIPHPMEDKHYIEWIQIIADGKACRQFLQPSDAPEVTFGIKPEKIEAREFCNVHGLWKGELE